MKGKRNSLVALIMGLALGWVGGYLRLPLVEERDAFWVGALAGLMVATCVAFLFFIYRSSGNREPRFYTRTSKPITFTYIQSLVLLILLITGVASNLYWWRVSREENQRLNIQNRRLTEFKASIPTAQQYDWSQMMQLALAEVDRDLNSSEQRTLQPATIDRVASASSAMKPYRRFYEDTLSTYALSPERGQLLLSLASMGIDSTSFAQLKTKTDFSFADLRDTDLRGLDLSAAQLHHAWLPGADLRNTDLNHTNLREANLNSARLTSAEMSRSNLNRADLRWTQLDSANLFAANLNGALLGSAIAQFAKFDSVMLRFASAPLAIFRNSTFHKAQLFAADLKGADLSGTDLSYADLRKTTIQSGSLERANLDITCIMSEDWLLNLEKWDVRGLAPIQSNYKIIRDTISGFTPCRICLIKVP